MDFLDPNKKRAHKVRLYIGYALMAIAISLGAVILLYAAYGYGVDRRGNVFQNGLVFLASTPDAAQVKIDSEDGQRSQTAITSDRLVLPAGRYDFEFLKQGYKPWQRTVELKGGGIQRLVYPFLFPEQFQSTDAAVYPSMPRFATVSPDRGTILVQRPNEFLAFDVYDANDPEKAATSFSLSAGLLTPGNNQKLELVEWSTNNRHLLVKHTYSNKTEFIIIDRDEPVRSTNINTAFALAPKRVLLHDKNPDQLYIEQSDGVLLRADVSAQTKQTLVRNVRAFQPHGEDMLLYVAGGGEVTKGNVGVYVLTGGETFKLRELPSSPTYLVDLAQYNGNWLVAAGAASDDRVYIYRNPITILKANNPEATLSIRTLRIQNPEHLSFSANTQFIAVQSGQTFDVYDALEDRQYHFTINTAFDKGSGKATWMDGHRLLTSTKGKITVFDFDGSNYQLLTGIAVGSTPMFDRDYTNLYALAPSVNSKNQPALVRTPLRVEAN